jgi:DEAD/DEAH box helicase domain-containing protein
MHYVVIDTEIEKEIPKDENGKLRWNAARSGECGLSCAVVYDSETERYHVYDKKSIRDLVLHLRAADMVVSFNGDGFDFPLLEAIYGGPLEISVSYDILQAIWDLLGKKTKGYKLNDISTRTLGISKTGEGSLAPVLWAEGRIAEVIDYCIADVWITKKLFDHIVEHGNITDIDGGKLEFNNSFGNHANEGRGHSPESNQLSFTTT